MEALMESWPEIESCLHFQHFLAFAFIHSDTVVLKLKELKYNL